MLVTNNHKIFHDIYNNKIYNFQRYNVYKYYIQTSKQKNYL